jgi:hypothetical protein
MASRPLAMRRFAGPGIPRDNSMIDQQRTPTVPEEEGSAIAEVAETLAAFKAFLEIPSPCWNGRWNC